MSRVGQQLRHRLLDDVHAGRGLSVEATGRQRPDREHAVFAREERQRREAAATVVHHQSVPQPGVPQTDESPRRLLAHGESIHELEVVAEAHQIRLEPGSQGHFQAEHGLAGAQVLRHCAAGDRHHRVDVGRVVGR